MLGTTRRRNGQLQVTYNHHPLYTYAGDSGPGQEGGQDCFDTSGHFWYMINTRGKPVTNIPGCQGY
jgi:predicted lipoprotein with Yx(FWY)xxD motif